MTQKELAYVEDATQHESAMIQICNTIINNLKTKELKEFMQEELNNHVELHNDLINFLEDNLNE